MQRTKNDGNMAVEVIEAVSDSLLKAEREYDDQSVELEGFAKVLSVLKKLGQVRGTKAQQGEDISALDDLLRESQNRMRDILSDERDEQEPFGVDFFEWAREIETDLRAQDPLMLSFDSESEDGERPKSSRFNGRDVSNSSRGASTMLSILKSNGRFSVKSDDAALAGSRDGGLFYISSMAWTFAVIGMMITIGFLARDFVQAQQSVAIQIERSGTKPLELPAITMCGNLQNIPIFPEYPIPGYRGLPNFGISYYSRSNRTGLDKGNQRVYPQTLPDARDAVSEYVLVSENRKANKQVRRGFDVLREMKTIQAFRGGDSLRVLSMSEDESLHCLRIGVKKKELLYPFRKETSATISPAVQVTLFKSRMFDACQSSKHSRNIVVVRTFASELEIFAKDLEEKGILDFSGENYTVLRKTLLEMAVPYHINFYCNVYFFSGFFYPSLDNADIKYKYNKSKANPWVETGKGPYFSAYSWAYNAPLVSGPSSETMQNDTYSLGAIRLFAEESANVNKSEAVSPRTSLSFVGLTDSAVYRFRMVNMGGRNAYRVKQAVGSSGRQSYKIVDTYQLGFDFETFETERILTSPTMSWPEFLTDVFEFVGLFTGICIFTLIVAPAHQLV